ncbi:tyrosine-type recombinase/integrase [Halomonas sp.]|uniref:tyrosine-type recombinase/integrase n=1 Tax=Halomonas sp. TaxID=1486246 RepID=UPI0038504736
MKLTAKVLEHLAKAPPAEDIWDTDLHGFHVRPGKRGLTFRLHYRTKTGKRRLMTLGAYGTLTAIQARKNATEALAIVAQGGDPRAVIEEAKAEEERQQLRTLGAYLDGPYTVVQHRKKDGEATLRRIRHAFEGWLHTPMSEITRSDVERWQGEREAKGEAYSTSTRSLGALKTLLAHAAERKVIPVNPLTRISLQKPAKTEEDMAEQAAQRRYLEKGEVEALFIGLDAYQDRKREQRRLSRIHGKAYLPDLGSVDFVDHVKPWILTMYYTGFRPGDITGLRWEHVNLTFCTIRKVIEKTAHHHPDPMTFPLSSALVKVLTTWRHQKGEPKAGLVFPSSRNGNRMDRTAMQKPWATVRKLAGLPDDLQLYSLRHNFASQLVMAGADLLAVSRLMAHTDIQTTVQHYAHLRPDHTRDIVEEFAKRTPSGTTNKTDNTE